MTGYGRGAVERRGARAAVEIRAVNHRFLDVKLRGSALSPELEEAVMAAVRKRLERGAVQMVVRAEQRGESAALQIDREAARRAHAELSALRAELGLDEPVTLALLCTLPGVLVARPDDGVAGEANAGGDAASQPLSRCVLEAVEQALAALLLMRETEGAALARDLEERLGRLAGLVDEIAAHAESAPGEAARRLEERLARLLEVSAVAVSPERLAQEVAILADRLDVTEETIRLRSHIEQFGAHVRAGEQLGAHVRGDVRERAVGRRLDFLVQEMGRELNTIASKSHALAISRAVVDARAELEKIREQVQNIE